MKIQNKSFCMAVKYTLYVLILLGAIFIGATMLWICITSKTIAQFDLVLSRILKNAGSYSVLLVGIVITTFFQVYSKEHELEKEDRIKIGEVGYYTLSFPLKKNENEYEYEEVYVGDKLVVEISGEEDYFFSAEKENHSYFHFMAKFLTSKSKSTNIKNIMAFSEEYFENNKKKILKNYYQYCESIAYCSPLYCATKPTSELITDKNAERNRYFWLILKCNSESNNCIKNFWISGITEEGILLFIKVKARICLLQEKGITKAKLSLLQQTTYYESHNELCILYK